MADGTQAAATPPLQEAAERATVRSARWRAGLVIVSGGVLVLAVASWLAFLWHALHEPVGQYDLSSYYAAAAALRADPHADIYSAAVIARSGAAQHVQVQPPLPYTYPPLLAILMTPLTFVPFRIAARAWLLVNAGLWLGCTLALASELRYQLGKLRLASDMAAAAQRARTGWARTGWARAVADPTPLIALAVAAALCLPFAPAQQVVLLGQIDLLVLLPLALVPWLTRNGHERWVGVAIAVAAMLKLTPALLLVYLALRRRWEALIAAVVALAVLAVVSVAVVGPGVFLAALPEALRVGAGDAALGQNEALLAPVLGVVTAASPAAAGVARAVEYGLLTLLAAVAGWVLWRGRGQRATAAAVRWDDGEQAAYALALCAMVLLSPATWVHHYVWVLPALVLMLGMTARAALDAGAGAGRRAAALRCGLVVLAAVLLSPSLPNNWDTESHPITTLLFGLPLRPALLEARPVGALLVLCVAAIILVRGVSAPGRERGVTA